MEFSRREYWSGLPFPSPEELSNPWIEPWFSALQADSLPFELQGSPYIGLAHESRSFMFVSVTPWTTQSMEFSRPEYSSG